MPAPAQKGNPRPKCRAPRTGPCPIQRSPEGWPGSCKRTAPSIRRRKKSRSYRTPTPALHPHPSNVFHDQAVSAGTSGPCSQTLPASVNPANCQSLFNVERHSNWRSTRTSPTPVIAELPSVKAAFPGPRVRSRHPRMPFAPPLKKACSSGSEGVFFPALANPMRTLAAWTWRGARAPSCRAVPFTTIRWC